MKIEINNVNFIDVNYLASDEFKERIKQSKVLLKFIQQFEERRPSDLMIGSKFDKYV